MAFSIEDIRYVLGERKIDVQERFPDAARLVARTGIPTVFETDGTALDLATAAGHEIVAANGADGIGALIYVTQSPSYNLPSHACILHENLRLPREVMAFDVNQGCAGFAHALTIALGLLPAAGKALIVCADRYRAKLREDDRSTQCVFSDGASATLISSRPELKVLAQTHETVGSGKGLLYQSCGPEENDGFLHMSGSDVFLFTRKQVAPQLHRTLAMSGFLLSDLDNVFVHQASAPVVDSLISDFRAAGAVPRNVERFGNTVSSTIPILMQPYLDVLKTARSAICGFGVGLSSSCIVIGPAR
jgi:3-oxoacyl-[acyl-carrier-protein] synthase-3